MTQNDMDRFKQTYITECYELLEDMEQLLMSLDEEKIDLEQVNAIFRCAHSIKGGAGAFGYTRLSQVTHVLETLLDGLREGKASVTQSMIDTLLASVDVLKQLVDAASAGQTPDEQTGSEIVKELEAFIEACISGSPAKSGDSDSGKKQQADDAGEVCIYDVSFIPHENLFMTGNEPVLILKELASLGEATVTPDTSKLPPLEQLDPELCYLSWTIALETEKPESALQEVFEFVEDECDLKINRIAGVQKEIPVAPVEDKNAEAAGSNDNKAKEKADTSPKPAQNADAPAAAVATIRVDIDKIDRLVNMVGELVITQAMLAAQAKLIPADTYPGLINGIDELSQHSRELQEAVMSVRMQPVKSVFSRMPRLVRDLSRQLEKDIKLEMSGENTEVDKTVIEQLSDPLTHMIRNSVDHGISTPEERVKEGKPAQGHIKLSAEHRGGRIVITVRDDGRGINREKVLVKAREKGVVSQDSTPTDEEIDALIFAPGFSTAAVVSDVSGRGVGMDVVRRNIEELGGFVHIQNHPGEGTAFIISLPLTLAILDGMIVRVGNENYIIPISSIIETLRPTKEDIRKVAEGNDLINVRGEYMSLLCLSELFGIKDAETNPLNALIVLVENGIEKFGLMVDELVGQQQVVIKSLEENSDAAPGISGATILGDGKVSLIIDIASIQAFSQTPRTVSQSQLSKTTIKEAAL